MSSVLSAGRRRWRDRTSDSAWRGGGIPINTVVSGMRTIVGAVVQVALLSLLLHRLGPAPSGLFYFATTLTGYFTAFEYGLGTSVTKYVAEHRATEDSEQLGSILRASLLLMVGIGVVVAVAVALLAVLGGKALFGGAATGSQAVPTLLVAGATALLYWPSRLGNAALQGLERYDLNAIVQMTSSVLMFGFIFAASEVTHSVVVLTAIFGLMLVLGGAVAGVLAWPHLSLKRGVGRWRGAHLRPALGFGAGLFLIGLSDTLVYESDRIVLAAFAGAAAIAIYQIALTPHTGVRLINGLIPAAQVATSARLVAQERSERLRALTLVSSFYGIVLTLPFVVLTLVLAHPMVEALFGPQYGRYAVYVQIFVSYWIISINGGPLMGAITGLGDIHIFVWITAVSASVTLALSIWFVTMWGTVGVIWGTAIPAWLGTPLWMHYALRHVGIRKRRYAREVLAPSYLPIAVWTIPVLVLAHVLEPAGLVGVGAFSAVALLGLWIALAPMLRARWRNLALVDTPSAVASA